MDYEELYRKYQKLLEENKRLKIENEDCKNRLGLSLPLFSSEVHLSEEEIGLSNLFNDLKQVTNASLPQDKLIFLCRCSEAEKMYMQRNGRVKKASQDTLLSA